MMNTLTLLRDYEVFSSLDIQFGRFAERLSKDHPAYVGLAAALVSRFTREGHVCIDLSEVADKEILPRKEGRQGLHSPPLTDWLRTLQKSTFVGTPGDWKPLILDDGNRLYLHRYWRYQETIAAGIKSRILRQNDVDPNRVRAVLDALFPSSGQEDWDWQKVAAFVALSSHFTVITGGPGTGKTSTVAKLLALVLELEAVDDDRIALLSPTGKGAIRLGDAMAATRKGLPVSERVKASLPTNASTIHRLLGGKPGSSEFRFHRENRLPLDMVIIDEASMVDLPLMAKLVDAVPNHSKLLLLGDRDQLASVEAGAVLADICDGGPGRRFSRAFLHTLGEVMDEKVPGAKIERRAIGLEDCIVHLKQNYRFSETSGIGSLSRAVKKGQGREVVNQLQNNAYKDICFHPIPPSRELSEALRSSIVQGFRGYMTCNDPWDSLLRFDAFRILCAVREGPCGLRAVNNLVETCLESAGFIHRNRKWYPRKPVMITKNDYGLGLFNGDVGIAFPDGQGDLRVMFQSQDGVRRLFHPNLLPAHETTFAVTVHKSQGSEFDHVLFLLPDKDNPILSRELIYTGMTRARERVDLWGSAEVIERAVKRQIHRHSGLRERLWG
jgi:exodeoxyribonuclease V alpha subunit